MRKQLFEALNSNKSIEIIFGVNLLPCMHGRRKPLFEAFVTNKFIEIVIDIDQHLVMHVNVIFVFFQLVSMKKLKNYHIF